MRLPKDLFSNPDASSIFQVWLNNKVCKPKELWEAVLNTGENEAHASEQQLSGGSGQFFQVDEWYDEEGKRYERRKPIKNGAVIPVSPDQLRKMGF